MAVTKNPSGFDYQEFLQKCRDELAATLRKFKKLSFKNWEEVGPLMYAYSQAVVALIEEKATEIGGLPGETKKQVALDLICGAVAVPGLPEDKEREIAERLIEMVVIAFNVLKGKKWPVGIFKLVSRVLNFIKKLF